MRTLPLCSNKINRLQFSLTLCLSRENQFLTKIYHIAIIMSTPTKAFINNCFFGSNIIEYH